VTASDISPKSLALLARSVPAPAGNLSTTVADIEALPFGDAEFDVVASAGVLSYGDPGRVRDEIRRVLKPGGRFICVDSLNHNPIYRFNRWLHYVRGARSASTLRRMPSLRSIDDYRRSFGEAEVWYFGAAIFLVPLAARLGGELRAAKWSNAVDRAVRVKRSAFKFVMVATKGT
jgi:ubiquinone/menaquinone biosynthesis C-methylase UbiE